MKVICRDWVLDKSLFEKDLVMSLLTTGERLGISCTSLLEGKEEEERSYLGFGQGWIIQREGDQEEPLIHLRGFMNQIREGLERLEFQGVEKIGDHSGSLPESCETKISSRDNNKVKELKGGLNELKDGFNELESGIVGYLDYEWGLLWQKPVSVNDNPGYFFRLCPINIVILPETSRVVLEIFAEEAEQALALFRGWEQEINLQLNKLTLNKSSAQETQYNSEPITLAAPSQRNHPSSRSIKTIDGGWTPNMAKASFIAGVERIKELIRAGDIFQAVFSQRFYRSLQVSPWILYRRLRQVNPSPYLFLVEGSQETLVGSSPELLISTKGKRVSTCPIAGTRPRGETPEQDLSYEQELRADPKENAEHAMLVDLGRNDLGRVSRYGRVKVTQYAEVERYSHVMHLVSRVEGELAPEFDSLDALKAAFPAGTLSGAPKVRAMEIIQELEPQKRGAYGGSLGVVRWNGDIDFCITIRTIRITNEEVSVQAGAGIVYDSEPEKEYEETLHKAKALMKVVNECAHSD